MGKQVLEAIGGYRKLVEAFEKSDGDKAIFWWRAHMKPIREVRFVYIVIGNKVRWRASFIGMEPGGEKTFDDGRIIYARNWMLLCGFTKMIDPVEKRKGTQGFRYKEIY